MIEHLFGSKTRLKLIRLFFKHADRPYFVRELTRVLNIQINAVRRELELLIKAGLVKEIDNTNSDGEAGNQLRKYYTLNTTSLLYPELQSLLLKDQIIEQQEFVDHIREKGGHITLLLLTGQFTGDKRAPSDLLIVGEIKERVLAKMVADHEQEFGFEIRYTVMTDKEFMDRRHVMDKFLYSIFEAENVKVINDYNI